MLDELGVIRQTLVEEIVPGLSDLVPNLQISVGQYTDFELAEAGYGALGNDVFELLQVSTRDLVAIDEAVHSLYVEASGDSAEALVEALYLSVTGESLEPWVREANCVGWTYGYPCWRRDGALLILAFTDAPSHNGPRNTYPYDTSHFPPGSHPHTYPEALQELRRVGARVIGFNSGEFGLTGREDLEQLARDTGAVHTDGTPLVYDIGRDGGRLTESVVESVRTLINTVPSDLDLVFEDHPGDDVDATEFVERVVAVGAEPPEGATVLADRFEDVSPGTRVTFRVLFSNDLRRQGTTAQSYLLWVILRANEAIRLRTQLIEIVVPPAGAGEGCDP